MNLLPWRQYQTCRCCYATNITQLKHADVAMHTILNMHVLSCSQYHSAQACSCCYAHHNKHAVVAMQPISLSQSMQLLPCTQHQTHGCCHAANITQLKHEAVTMHTIPNMNCSMQPKSLSSNIQLLHAYKN